jgi:bifunctional DNase/RNase
MEEMELIGVRVELPSNVPILLLREKANQRRVVPIFIGGPEATAIAFALDGVETPRPMTHDLMVATIAELGASLVEVAITDLDDGTFYAELHLRRDDEVLTVSSRPSDAIALAVRVGCAIVAAPHVIDEVGTVFDDEEGDDEPEEVVEQFREFIENVNPEDFAS